MSLLSKNPWRSIWTHPCETIEHIVHKNSSHHLFWLAAIYGMPLAFRIAQSFIIEGVPPPIQLIATTILLCPIIGFLGLEIGAGLLFWSGSWLGLKGSFKAIRAALGWSNLPSLIMIPIWGLLFSMFGSAIFFNNDIGPISAAQGWILLGIAIVDIGFSGWCLVWLIQMLSVVQKSSKIRSFLNAFLAFLLFFLIVFIINWSSNFIAIANIQQTS